MKGTLIPILSFTVAILVYVFYIDPHYTSTQEIQSNIDIHKEAVEKYTVFNARVQELLAKRDTISLSNKERLELLIPSKIDTTRLVVDLEKIARDGGVLFGNVEADEDKVIRPTAEVDIYDSQTVDTASLLSADISFSVIGTYEQFKSFMTELENSLPLFEITKISLQAGTETFQQFDVSLRTFAIPSE